MTYDSGPIDLYYKGMSKLIVDIKETGNYVYTFQNNDKTFHINLRYVQISYFL